MIEQIADQITEYDAWLQANHTDERDTLMVVPVDVYEAAGTPPEGQIPLPVVDDAAAIARNIELISDWAAGLP